VSVYPGASDKNLDHTALRGPRIASKPLPIRHIVTGAEINPAPALR